MAWALERLICEHVLKFAPAAARCDRDVFRAAKLYTPAVEEIFRKNYPALRALFSHYAEESRARATSEATTPAARARARDPPAEDEGKEAFSLGDWLKLLHEGELLDAHGFGQKEAALCFLWSQMFVADEVKRRGKSMHLSFEGFMEAIARITCFKALPTTKQLLDRQALDKKCRTVADFLSPAQGEGKLAEFASQNAPDWRKEEKEGRHLEEVLEKLMGLLIARFNVKDGVLARTLIADHAGWSDSNAPAHFKARAHRASHAVFS